jgi:hypothetical protein
MKDPERVLTEIAKDRITFDGGKGVKMLTRQNIDRLITAIMTGHADARLGDRAGNARKGRMAKQIVYWPDAIRLGDIIRELYQPTLNLSMILRYEDMSSQFFARFESLKELLQYFWNKSVKPK